MRWPLLLLALSFGCRRDATAHEAPEASRLLPEGFVEPTGRGDDPIPVASESVTLWVGPRDVRETPRGPSIVAFGPEGFAASVKEPASEAALLVRPLATALAAARNGHTTLVLHVDARTTYRTLTQILFTAGQQQLDRYVFVVHRANGAEGGLHMRAPRPGDIPAPRMLAKLGDPPAPTPSGDCAPDDRLDPTVVAVDTGWIVKARGANVAPGCEGVGSGITIAHDRGEASLTTCLEKIRGLSTCRERRIVTAANGNIDVQSVIRLWDAVRKTSKGDELFPDVMIGIAR